MTGANPLYLGFDYQNYNDSLSVPSAFAVDPDGALCVADTSNNRAARFFDMSDNGVLLLGTAGAGAAMFSQPRGILVVPSSREAPVPSTTPASLTFPTEVTRVPTPSQSASLTNIGNAPLMLSGVATSSADFPATNDCPTSLSAGENCTASVVFQPTADGLRKGTLSFTMAKGAANVGLKGSGTLISLSPSYLVLFEGGSGTVMITNPLTTTAGIKSIKLTSPFYEVADTCTAPLVPAPVAPIRSASPGP